MPEKKRLKRGEPEIVRGAANLKKLLLFFFAFAVCLNSVPRAGLEPARPCYSHGILSPERLPIPPPRRFGKQRAKSKRQKTIDLLFASCLLLFSFPKEATIGFEPMNRGFADLRLGPLGYVAAHNP